MSKYSYKPLTRLRQMRARLKQEIDALETLQLYYKETPNIFHYKQRLNMKKNFVTKLRAEIDQLERECNV